MRELATEIFDIRPLQYPLDLTFVIAQDQFFR